MKRHDYDLIIIGAGAAGFVSSKLAAGLGKKVALIEQERLGGECTWHGCVPSKALIKSSKVAHLARTGALYGIDGTAIGPISCDRVLDHVRSVVQNVYQGHLPETFEALGIDVIFGEPAFTDNHTILVGGRRLSTEVFVIATGSSAFVPPIEGLSALPYLTNRTVFELDRLPPSMIVLGGGPIGIELSAAMNRLGVRTSVVEMFDRILMREEKELTDLLADTLRREGVNLLTGTKAVRFSGRDGGVVLTVEEGGGLTKEIEAASVLVAVGRQANVRGIALEKAGVAYSQKGIVVDSHLRTTTPNIYACGDVAGPYQFSHMAEYQARIGTLNALYPVKRKCDYTHVGWCTYTDPEFAHIGMTEEEALASAGPEVEVYRWNFGNIDRGKTDLAGNGRAKFVCDAKGRLLGAHILGDRAGEVIHETQLMRYLGVPFHKIESMIHIYPAFNDIIKSPSRLALKRRLETNPYLRLLRKLTARRR